MHKPRQYNRDPLNRHATLGSIEINPTRTRWSLCRQSLLLCQQFLDVLLILVAEIDENQKDVDEFLSNAALPKSIHKLLKYLETSRERHHEIDVDTQILVRRHALEQRLAERSQKTHALRRWPVDRRQLKIELVFGAAEAIGASKAVDEFRESIFLSFVVAIDELERRLFRVDQILTRDSLHAIARLSATVHERREDEFLVERVPFDDGVTRRRLVGIARSGDDRRAGALVAVDVGRENLPSQTGDFLLRRDKSVLEIGDVVVVVVAAAAAFADFPQRLIDVR